MCTLLQVLFDNGVSRGAYPILGGDFNARIGPVSRSDDVDLVGCFGFGERNAQGMLLARWDMQNGLYIANRQGPAHQIENSWTCRRSSDGTLTQIDFIILDRQALFDNTFFLNTTLRMIMPYRKVWIIVVYTALLISTPHVLHGEQDYKK